MTLPDCAVDPPTISNKQEVSAVSFSIFSSRKNKTLFLTKNKRW